MIPREQLFEDGNHRTEILFNTDAVRSLRMMLEEHLFKLHKVFSNLEEQPWPAVHSHLAQCNRKNGTTTAMEQYGDNKRQKVKEIPLVNTWSVHGEGI